MKRCVDIVISLIGLTILMPLFLIVAILIKINSKGPVFFKQERIGKRFKPFIIYKFRTMVDKAPELGPHLTVSEDNRITKIGKFLRQIKIDELPQLFNVLKGNMSLVGPRPEVRKYVDEYKDDYKEILKVRPGITDLASIEYREESSLLSQSDNNPETHYLNVILPEKLRLAKRYIKNLSFLYDMRLILSTLFYIIYPHNRIDMLLESIAQYRKFVVILVQGFLIVLANFLAFYIRFEGTISAEEYHLFIYTLPFLLALRLIFLCPFSLFQSLWMYVGIKDLQNIVASVTLSSLSFVILTRGIIGITLYPRSVYIIDWLISIALLVGIRLMKRLHDGLKTENKDARSVLVIGGHDTTERVLREILNHRHYHYNVVGLIDDDPYKRGLKIHNVPILGTTRELEDIIRKKDPDEILVAMPTASSNLMRQIVKECKKFGKPIKIVPGLEDVLFGKKFPFHIRNIEPEDLLFRDTISIDFPSLKPFFEGKKVMITGAGGTIGSEISRQVANYNPSQLILFERHEGSLYNIEIGLRNACPEIPIYPVIGDITDSQRVAEVIGRTMPQIIFHAAANKHVPMMELNPSEAIKTNILGTKIVAEVASKFNVEVFVLISTDKAVDPVSVMGVSKKVAELTVQRMNGPNKTRFITVRFGNVLESSGSVVPLFKEQIRKGGPLTVTHPYVKRYFMTLTEAVQLLLQAATMGRGGEVFVLDMGKPVKVLDIAKRLANLYGFEPGKDIEIIFTGLRPGERLFEMLFNHNEKVENTAHPKILTAVNGVVGKEEGNGILKSLRLIEEAVSKGSVPDALNVIKDLVPTYQPQPNRGVTLGVGETNLMEVNR